jgi:methionyl-tRNA formyltransferase
MNIVFMGTPSFAVESLDIINKSHHNVVGVITATDKPAGRGQKLSYSDVKQYALDNNLNLLQPSNLKDEEFIAELKDLNADLFVVVAFRMLPEVVWKMPKKGTINLHASILPHYRGAAPINWAIINGETESGASTFFIEEKIDTGNIIEQFKTPISTNMNAGELHDILMEKGAQLLLNTINKIEEGSVKAIPQSSLNIEEPKKAFKIFKETCLIDWSRSAQEIHNLIRGLSPYPAAYTTLSINGKDYNTKVFKSERTETFELNKGQINTDYKTFLTVGTGNGDLSLLEIQLAGKNKMDIKSFLNGNKNNVFAITSL